MQPTGMTSAAASAPAVLELAEASRWRAPEVTAVLAEHAAQLARDSGDLRTALLAEGWLAQGLASLGHGVAAVPRAVNALAEATRENQGAASDRLRVALAGVARSLDDRSAGLVLLAPVLAAGGASPRLHADAHLEAVLCRDGGDDGAASSADVAVAALRQIGGEYGELGLASADAALAGQLRARRQLGDAVERARSGLRRLFGDQPAGGPLQPVSPYLAASLGLELTLALLDAGQQDAALESARLVMRWDVQPGSLVPTARLQLALAQRVYLPAGARDEVLAAVEWVARAVARRELPEIEVECHGLLAELRERSGELSEALAASRQGHAAYRALASAVERAVVLLVRAAGEASPPGRREQLDGQGPEAGPPALADRAAPPVPAVGHVAATGQAPARAESGVANGAKPPWMTSAGPAWRPSVETARHPGSVTPRGPGADSLAGAGQGADGRGANNVFRLFEGGAARSDEAAAASPEPKAPRGPSDPLLPADPADPLALGQSLGSAGYDLRASLETTDPLLGRTMAGERSDAGRGGPLGLDPTARSSLGGPGPATSPDLLRGAGPLSRFDRLSGTGPSSGVGGPDPLSGVGQLAGDPLAGPGPLAGSDPLSSVGRRSEPDPLAGDTPLSGYDPLSGPDALSGSGPLSGYGPSSGSDALSGAGPLSGYGPLSGSDPLGGAGPTAALGAVPATGWRAAAERLTKPGRSIGGSSLGGPVVPVGLSIAQLAVELLGINTGTGQPPHLVLIDIATPDGSASGPEVVALTARIASRVREQLPPAARLYLVEQDAVAVALPEVDPEAVTRWVRSVSTGLSLRWDQLAAELPRAVFRIDVRALDRDRTIAEQLWDLRIGQNGQARGGHDTSPASQPPGDEQPPPTGRHLAGTLGPAPVGLDPEPNRINAQPGSGGRRRRPDAGPGSVPGGKAIGQLGPRRQDTSSAGPSDGRLTSRHRDSSSVIPTGRTEGFREAGGLAPGAVPGPWAVGHAQLIGTPIARLATAVDQPSAVADAARNPESGRIALAESPRADDDHFADHAFADPSLPPLARIAANGSTANGSTGHEVSLPGIGALRMPNGSVLSGSATVNGSATHEVTANGTAVNGTAVNGTVVNGGAPHRVARNGSAVNGAVLNGSAANGATGSGMTVNGGATNGAAVNGAATNGSSAHGTTNRAAVNGAVTNGSLAQGTTNGAAVNGAVTNGSATYGATNGARTYGATSASNGASTNGASTNGAAVRRATAEGTGAAPRPEATGEGADTPVDPSADGDADPADGAETGHSGRSRRRNGRAGPPRGAAATASTPVSELSFAELLAGALAAYRES